MSNKILFFDIDGTLIAFGGGLPQSAKEALHQAQQNGHKIVICTGRSLGQLQSQLDEIPFDGYVCAAGAYVSYGGRIISQNFMPERMLQKLVQVLAEEQAVYALQCVDHTVTTKELYEPLVSLLSNRVRAREDQVNRVFGNMQVTRQPQLLRNVEKAVFYEADHTVPELREKLGSEFDVVEMTFMNAALVNGEITQAGINKAYGMDILLKYLGMDRKDSIAFGDGSNDIEMMQFAGIGVAMGNAGDEVKKNANMVTRAVDDDGIYYAMKELGII